MPAYCTVQAYFAVTDARLAGPSLATSGTRSKPPDFSLAVTIIRYNDKCLKCHAARPLSEPHRRSTFMTCYPARMLGQMLLEQQFALINIVQAYSLQAPSFLPARSFSI